jgi:PPOX class probable F420-dependent enzyme
MIAVSGALAALLAEPSLAVIGTKRREGSVALTPVWFEYRDETFWVNGYETALWPKHVQRQSGAALLVIDPAEPLRVAQADCQLEAVQRDGARDHIDALARRYTGEPYTGPHEERLIIRLRARRIRSRL